jgi:hypothetical protein
VLAAGVKVVVMMAAAVRRQVDDVSHMSHMIIASRD